MRFTSWFHWIHGPINATNLAGAVDVIVIRRLDGTLKASPFYVRFGKLGVIRSEGKDVYIHVNGVLADLHMVLSDEGQAYFQDHDNVDDVNESANSDECYCSDDAMHGTRAASLPPNTQIEEPLSSDDGLNPSLHYPQTEGSDSKNYENGEPKCSSPTPRQRLTERSIHRRKIGGLKKNKRDTSVQLQRRSMSQDVNSYSDGEIPMVNDRCLEKKSLSPASCTVLASEFACCCERASSKRRLRASSVAANFLTYKPDKDSQVLLIETHIPSKRMGRPDLKANSKTSMQDSSMCRCASDSDLDRDDNLLGQATFFLTEGRKAISEILLVEDSDDQDDECSIACGAVPSSANIDPSANASKHDVGKEGVASVAAEEDTCGQCEPPIFNLSSLAEAKWYIRLLEQDVLRLNWVSHFDSDVVFHRCLSKYPTGDLSNLRGKQDRGIERSISGGEKSATTATGGSDRTQQQSSKNQSYGMMRLLQPLLRSTPQDTQATSTDPSGLYLGEALSKIGNDPDVKSTYFSRSYDATDGEQESGRGTSLASPDDFDTDPLSAILGDVSLSDCGGLATAELTSEEFDKHLITEQTFIDNPDVIYSPNLVVRINNRYYNWPTAAPMILSAAMFHQKLPQNKIDSLVEKYMPTKTIDPKRASSGWWIFGRGWSDSGRSQAEAVDKKDSRDEATVVTDTVQNSSPDSDTNRPTVKSRRICLTSKELESLNLKYGENELTFSVTTPLQGTSVVTASVFLFHETDKFVISDIDGTITRSDVIGHILPLVGRDWSHDGIAEFFCAIADNGYNFIYVSSRSIGQSALTRDYLRNLKQRGFELPRGPALLSPDSLFNALYREVVAKKPEEFKIACLKTISSLFPDNTPPFYAGFGNRVNDQWAYTAVGIPLQRIFTINPSGVVKHHASDFSSYKTLHEIVDQLFPPVFRGGVHASLHGPQEYSSFTYWKDDFV